MKNVKQTKLSSKLLAASLLIATGILTSYIGDQTSGNLLIMTGLAAGGWAQGLHTELQEEEVYEDDNEA